MSINYLILVIIVLAIVLSLDVANFFYAINNRRKILNNQKRINTNSVQIVLNKTRLKKINNETDKSRNNKRLHK